MENKTNGLSIAGFVVSCCSMLIGLYGVVGLVGLILSAIGRSQAKNEGGKTGLAIWIMAIINCISQSLQTKIIFVH